MASVLESLKSEHRTFRRYLDLFEAEIAKYETGESPDYPLIDLLLSYFTSFPDAWHHRKEDHVYDVLIAKPGETARRLYDLHAEHERLRESVEHFAGLIEHLRMGGDVPADVLLGDGRAYANLLREHMRKEDEEFLPAAEMRLDEKDWNAIARAIEHALAESGGAKLGARLTALEDSINEAAQPEG